VDVITSNHTLAKRDAEASHAFFTKLKLTVGYITSKSKAKDFEPDIVFGTVHNFCLGVLQYYMGESPVVREQEMLIVDEVDSMFIDKPQITTFISSKSIYSKEIKEVWFEIWEKLGMMRASLSGENHVEVMEDKEEEIKRNLKEVIADKVGQEKCAKLRNFMSRRINTWIENAMQACKMVENTNYIAEECKVKIVERDTGEVKESMQWPNGLHYFLELKHGIDKSDYNSSFLFENHMTYMKRYKSNIIGLSGTLGTKVSQDFLKENYDLDMLMIPPYCPLRLEIKKPIFCKDQSSWSKRLVFEIEQNQKKKLPILLLFETIKDGQDFGKILTKKNTNFNYYLRSNEENNQIFNLNNTSIILATNLGGRGTDFRVPSDISYRGGLQVIITFIPSNSRVERQAFGRAGRNGQQGSGRMIVDNSVYSWIKKGLVRMLCFKGINKRILGIMSLS
jgi:preprotein translocase subunit SecA